MRISLVIVLLLLATSVQAQICENTVRNWCYSQAVDPSRNCADLVARTCPRPNFDACVAHVIGLCRQAAGQLRMPGDSCANAAVAYCAQQTNTQFLSILNEANYCVRRRGVNTGEWCLDEALRSHNQ